MKMDTAPISLEAAREARRSKLPDVLTTEQLRRKAVARMRFTIMELIEDNSESAREWLDIVAMVDPKGALELYIKLLEFAVPKLSRAEVAVEDAGKTRTADLTMDELKQLILEARTIEGTATPVND